MDLKEVKQQIKNAHIIDTFGTGKEIRALPKIMQDNEVIQYATSGVLRGNTILLVCTNLRVLFLDKGLFFGLTSTEIPLSKINEVSYKKGLMFGSIIIVNGATQTIIKNVTIATIAKMTDAIQKATDKYNNSSVTTSSNISVAQQIRELKELENEGIITSEEFEHKKKQLLN